MQIKHRKTKTMGMNPTQTTEITAKSIQVTPLQQQIINNFQKDFPLCSQPYKSVAETFDVTEAAALQAVISLDEQGILSRVGPVFDHKKAGASTLAAIAVPLGKLDEIANIVNQFEQVNHNYAREHRYNLWFVVTASDPLALKEILEQLQYLTGLAILVLPMEVSYHIDLGFKINFENAHFESTNFENTNFESINVVNTNLESTKILATNMDSQLIKDSATQLTVSQQSRLRNIIEKGLPQVNKPYWQVSQKISATEQQVINQIKQWQDSGLIRRFGLVVKHRRLGFTANAMVVWNIPTELVDEIAGQLSLFDQVSLCYRRPRRLPDWPYNLFCMIHGTDRKLVLEQISQISAEISMKNSSLGEIDKAILFITKAYKQHGARYSNTCSKSYRDNFSEHTFPEHTIEEMVEKECSHG